MAVLSLSRQFGAGGKTVGEMAAIELGYQFFYEATLDDLAQHLAQGQEQDWESDQGVLKIISALGPSNFIDRYAKDSEDDWDEKSHQEALGKVIWRLAEMDRVVILGRGSQFILRDHPGTIRVLLVARLEERIKFLTENYGLSGSEAERMIKRADKRRAKFLRQFYPSEPNESSLYHMVINTSLVSLPGALNQLVRIVRYGQGD